MDTSLADKNYEWFTSHLHELAKEHEGEYLVIKDCNVIGRYKTLDKAWTDTIKQERPGTFIIQLCTEDETQTMQTYFTNRVVFS